MRICHGLTGDVLEVEDQELQWRTPVEIVMQHACKRWGLEAAEDLIVLNKDSHVIVFLRSFLDPAVEVAIDELLPDPADVESHPEDELLRARAECGDPAFEAFRSHLADARSKVWEAKPIEALAARTGARLEVQRLAAEAVLEDLARHRKACSRSMALFQQKYERAQERLDQILGQVEASMLGLREVALHPAMRSPGRETLADVLPRERIWQFTANLQSERARLGRRLERLQQRDGHLQALCDQVATMMAPLLRDDSVAEAVQAIQREHSRAELELLPKLGEFLPQEGASPRSVLEAERQSAALLEGLAAACAAVLDLHVELRDGWERRQKTFLQRLREVSHTQSKVREVERQAALLEEELNSQRGCSQQLGHLQRMPKAYEKLLSEITRRREFRNSYLAQCEHSRKLLARMADEENCRRRHFFKKYGCHLPADVARGLGSLVPLVTVEVADFDASLPDLDAGAPETTAEAAVDDAAPIAPLGASGQATSAAAEAQPADETAENAAPEEAQLAGSIAEEAVAPQEEDIGGD
mmetsp:Transcript_55536/g.119870  ORF Transcript_55536/g.119870 Transcript_55536/m.119870 type:complete len:531 (-) Transcript_55536:373-1965(-)